VGNAIKAKREKDKRLKRKILILIMTTERGELILIFFAFFSFYPF